jgi:aminoglycoside phosphotransferase (APT) family kinase protein
MTALLRAHTALRQAGLTGAGRLEKAPNSTNEVWFIGRFVLFINPDGASRRLAHRANVLEHLPPGVPAPTFVGYGTVNFGEWLVEDRVRGRELSYTWSALSESERERAITALGLALRELHAVDAVDVGLDADAPFLQGDTLECPHQLPAGRLLDLLARSAQLQFVDHDVINRAVDKVLSSADVLDESPRSLIHGDLHFENVMCDGPRLVALIDFEWSRSGPPDLDLDVLLHSLADPALHVRGADDTELRRRDFERVTGWLRKAYPELFAHPRLVDRLTLYRLAYDTRALLQQPPDRPAAKLSPHHPYNRIVRLVEGRNELQWMLAG